MALGGLLTAMTCWGCSSGGGSGGTATTDGGAGSTTGQGGAGGSAGGSGGNSAGGNSAGGSSAGGADAGPCVPPAPGALAGSYLVTLSVSVQPKTPILFIGHLSTVADKGGTALSTTLQALDAKDRKTPVGNPIKVPLIPIASDGQFVPTSMHLQIDGRANAIQPGLNIDVTATMHGRMCGVADFYCGTVDGQVTKPAPLSLAGSTYTFDHIADPAKLPDPPLLDCAKDTAGPPP